MIEKNLFFKMIEKRIRLTLINTDIHGQFINNNQYLFLTVDQLNKAIIHSLNSKIYSDKYNDNPVTSKSKMYKLRLDGHFYTVLDDKIFNEISDQW